MIITPRTITENEWLEQYKPLPNPVNDGCGYDYGDGCTLVETYGEHLQYLDTIDAERIWTVLDDDNGNPCIVSGRHFVNRLGYIVTEKPWAEDIEVEIED